MIKFAASNNESGRPALGIGLTRENCDRLLEGQPIMLDTTNMLGLPVIDICLFAGQDDGSMTQDMLSAGAVTPEQIREDRSLGDPHIDTKEVN